MIVVDASAILEALFPKIQSQSVTARLLDPRETLHAPHLLDIEVAHAIRRYAARGDIDAQRGQSAIVDFTDFQIRRYPHDFLLSRIWSLRNNFTAYDAAYIALAEVLDAPLLTRDRRLAVAAGHHAKIELI